MLNNSSDNAMNYKRSKKMTNSIKLFDTPLKISEVPYFESKHRRVSAAMIAQKKLALSATVLPAIAMRYLGIFMVRMCQTMEK